MKIALAACAALVVAFVLYWTMRPKQQEDVTQPPKVKTETSNPPSSSENSSGSAAADKAAADKAARDKAAADEVAMNKAAADKAAADKTVARKSAADKAATVEQQATEDQTAAAAQTFAESTLKMFDNGDCSGLYDAFDGSARTLTRDAVDTGVLHGTEAERKSRQSFPSEQDKKHGLLSLHL